MAAQQAPPSLGFSRQEHWSGLPFPSPMHESEKWKWSRSFVSDSQRPHGLQPTRLLRPWVFPSKSTGVGCHCLLREECLAYSKRQMFAIIISWTSLIKIQVYWLLNCIGPVWSLLCYVQRLVMTCVCFGHNLSNYYILYKIKTNKKQQQGLSLQRDKKGSISNLCSTQGPGPGPRALKTLCRLHPGLWPVITQGLASSFLVNLSSILILNLAFSYREIRTFESIVLWPEILNFLKNTWGFSSFSCLIFSLFSN